MVWIHGGALVTGESDDYNPAKLVRHGVVVVTINYRLGALGFLADGALAARSGGPAGNYGLMDQQAALRWVQREHRPVRRQPAERDHLRRVGRRAERAVPGVSRRARTGCSSGRSWSPARTR